MKTKVASLLMVLIFSTIQSMAQKQITVEAQNNDISNNLDLKAVATVFGESKTLEDFEQKLNDYDSGISNLDLNNDGQVDYLRVIEKNENDVHVVVVQAVLDKDVYQDVASIVVARDRESNTTVQVIGDPYIYGNNYIIEPAYVYTPSIFSFFWGNTYFSWHSPYYWGYYPSYYHHRSPFELNIYLSHVYGHVNHNQRYYYTNSRRNNRAEYLYKSVRRNDYATRYPERTFSNRNSTTSVRNKRDLEFTRSGVVRSNQTRSSYQRNSNESRSVRSFDNNSSRNSQSNYNNSGFNQRNSTQRTYTPATNSRNSSEERSIYQNRSNTQTYSPRTNTGSSNVNTSIQRNNTYQPRINTDNGSRNSNSGVNSRSNSQVSQPRVSVPRSSDNSRSSETRSERSSESRSSNKDSRR